MISLLAAADALSSKLVSIHGFAFGCRCRLVSQACLSSYFRSWLLLPACLPSLSPFMISLLAAAAALSPKLVSLPDFALGCRCHLVSPSLSPFMLSLLAAAAALSPFMISLLAAAAALSPKLVSLHDFCFGWEPSALRKRSVLSNCELHRAGKDLLKNAFAMVSNFLDAIWGLCRYNFLQIVPECVCV